MDFGRAYLEIALGMRGLAPDWVDSYVGPAALADAVDRNGRVSADELRDRAKRLEQRVAEEEPAADRRAWLAAQLRGISTALDWLGGRKPDYVQLFARCHGGCVKLVDERQFEAAHALLDAALPGQGDVAMRFQNWQRSQLVAREGLQEGLERLGEDMRGRCHDAFDLPENERITWEVVTGKRWLGFAEYLGERHTLIRVNADRPISSSRLLELVCHEGYPGHHTENVCKDVSQIQASERIELAVYVYPTPQALLSEGLASYAHDALLGREIDEIAESCLGRIGIVYDRETAGAVRHAEELLLPVRSNVALMLDGGSTSAEVRDYARTWLLDDAKLVEKAIDDLEAGSWRPYESCYPVGRELCRRYVEAGGRFHDLLHRQLTPSALDTTCSNAS